MLDGLIRLASWNQKISYKSLEEALSVPAEKWVEFLESGGAENYVIVSTCNRLEIYYSSEEELSGFPMESLAEKYSGTDALNHLFRVTAGLESMSVGENEILHQVKEAFDLAIANKHVHDPLAFIFRKAISSGKLVRRDTGISRGKVSIPALSMDVLNRNHGVSGKNAAVIGTGKMASDVIKYLQKLKPAGITIVGRNPDKTASLASSLGTEWKPINELADIINLNQIIITATSSKSLIISREMLSGVQENKVFLDISNPRNVEEPLENDNFTLIDLKALNPILEKNKANKEKEITNAEQIVHRQAESLNSRLSKLEMEKLIASLYKQAEKLKENEISRLKRALASGTDFDEALEAMSSALVKKLLAFQTDVLRNVHGSKVTGDIREAIEGAYFGRDTKNASKKPRGRQGSQSQQDQTPQLSQTP